MDNCPVIDLTVDLKQKSQSAHRCPPCRSAIVIPLEPVKEKKLGWFIKTLGYYNFFPKDCQEFFEFIPPGQNWPCGTFKCRQCGTFNPAIRFDSSLILAGRIYIPQNDELYAELLSFGGIPCFVATKIICLFSCHSKWQLPGIKPMLQTMLENLSAEWIEEHRSWYPDPEDGQSDFIDRKLFLIKGGG